MVVIRAPLRARALTEMIELQKAIDEPVRVFRKAERWVASLLPECFHFGIRVVVGVVQHQPRVVESAEAHGIVDSRHELREQCADDKELAVTQ